MYVVKWNATVLGKAQYAMENPTCVTDRFCRAMLFVTAREAEEFKEKNYLEQFTVVEVSEDTVLKDMQEMLVEMKAQAKTNFRVAVMDAKRNGLDVEELHKLVDAPLRT